MKGKILFNFLLTAVVVLSLSVWVLLSAGIPLSKVLLLVGVAFGFLSLAAFGANRSVRADKEKAHKVTKEKKKSAGLRLIGLLILVPLLVGLLTTLNLPNYLAFALAITILLAACLFYFLSE